MAPAATRAGVGTPALEAAGVSKRYGDRDALSSVDLVARPGALHGLLGPNGAGKTTLLRVLLGLVRRDAGSVRLFGRDLRPMAGPLPDGRPALSRLRPSIPICRGGGTSRCSRVSTTIHDPIAGNESAARWTRSA